MGRKSKFTTEQISFALKQMEAAWGDYAVIAAARCRARRVSVVGRAAPPRNYRRILEVDESLGGRDLLLTITAQEWRCSGASADGRWSALRESADPGDMTGGCG